MLWDWRSGSCDRAHRPGRVCERDRCPLSRARASATVPLSDYAPRGCAGLPRMPGCRVDISTKRGNANSKRVTVRVTQQCIYAPDERLDMLIYEENNA